MMARIVQRDNRIAVWNIGQAQEITEVVTRMATAIAAIALTAGYMEAGYFDLEIVNENMTVVDSESLIA